MKTCTKCITAKSLDEFHYRNKKRGTRNPWCKSCAIKHRIQYFKQNQVKEQHKHNDYRRGMKILVDNYLKSHPCIDCGESDYLVLEFDHVRGKKLMDISLMRSRFSWKKIQIEIKKCEVRCANCHRRITYKRKQTIGT